jgi:GTP cyclohydrolase I
MDINRLETISFAEGFLEDFLDQYMEEIDEETASAKVLEQATQVKAMWEVLTKGLLDLRRECVALQMKIDSAKIVLT